MAYEYQPNFTDKLAEFLLGLAKLQESRQQRETQQQTAGDAGLDRTLRTLTAMGQLQSLESERQAKRGDVAEKLRRESAETEAAGQLYGTPRTQETTTYAPGQPPSSEQEFQGAPPSNEFMQRIVGRRRTPLHEALGNVKNPLALSREALERAAKLYPEEPLLKPEEPYTLGPGQTRFKGAAPLASVPREPKEPTAFGASRAEAIAALRAAGISTFTDAQIGAKLRQLNEESQIRIGIAPKQFDLGVGAPGQSPLQQRVTQEASAKQESEQQRVLDPEEAARLRVPYGTTAAGAAGQRPLTTVGEGQKIALEGSAAILGRLDALAHKVFRAQGPLERFIKAPSTGAKLLTQSDPDVVMFNTLKEGVLANIVRTFGERGTLTEGDINRARALLPTLWPIPDTREVAFGKLKQLREVIAEMERRQVGGKPQTTVPPSTIPPGVTIRR